MAPKDKRAPTISPSGGPIGNPPCAPDTAGDGGAVAKEEAWRRPAGVGGADQSRGGADQSSRGADESLANIRAIEILMLCTGNTCRSPMAAALLARRLDEAGVKAVVSSAGLLFDGKPATDHGQAVMADRGIDTSGHRSRKLRPEILTGADIVIGMARSHVPGGGGARRPPCWAGRSR